MSPAPKPKFSHRWPQHLAAMKLPIERTRALSDGTVTISPDDWVDDDTLEQMPIRCGSFFTTTENASWKAPYSTSPYDLPCEFYLCRPLTFYKTIDLGASLFELPLLPIGRVMIPYHGSGGKGSNYGRDWAWMGLPRQTVEAVRMFLAERGVEFDEAEHVKGQQVRTYYDKWWTMFQARFNETKIIDISGLSRSNTMGLQFILSQSKCDLYAAVAFRVQLTFGGPQRNYDEWKRTPMHLHFSPRIICVTGKSWRRSGVQSGMLGRRC